MRIKKLDRVMKELPQSSPEQWRLHFDEGEQEWKYVGKKEASKRPQTFQERYFLGIRNDTPKHKQATNFEEAAMNGYSFYQRLQLDDGHWASKFSGPNFPLPQLIFAMYITDTIIPQEWRTEIVRHLQTTVNEDGGWGLHPGGPSTAFATSLNYVMLRLFGLDKNVALLEDARECFLSLGRLALYPT
jgi:lanosterol synthase